MIFDSIQRLFLRLVLLLLIVAVLVCCKQQSGVTPQSPLFLPDDLEASLWAESPMFYNPTNMDVDARGRIWITEAVNYRNFNNDSTKFIHHNKGDRVIILEDTNHDGKADLSKVFVEDTDLVSPLGIAVLGNRIIVSCAPNLIVYTDEDGDDVPDKKEILLTGFGGLDHDHSLHSATAGPDGNLYFNTGNAGPHIVTDKSGWTLRSGSIYTGGTPYNKRNNGNMKSDDGKVWVGGLALRMSPDGSNLKVMGHNFRNSYEVITDSFGNLWQNDNDDQVVACRTSWLMEGGNAGFFSTDGTRYWQADQRPWQDIYTAHWHQDDPGIMPAGDRTGAGSPTGVAINEGDALGEKHRGLLLSADAGRNIIFGYHPTINGSGYDLGDRVNFITSLRNDNEGYVWNDSVQNSDQNKWFRPSDVTIGTDGAIYVADWYDPVVGGHQMMDSTGYGRIYRITPKGKNLLAPVYNLETTDGLIDALKSSAVNVRYLAFQKLKQSGDEAVESVDKLLESKNPYHQARAIWLLAQLGENGRQQINKLLDDSDALIRATAFRALRLAEKDILTMAEKLSNDESPFVRREVAIALRDLPFGNTKHILLTLIKQYDGEDDWNGVTLTSALAGHEDEIYPELKKIFESEDGKPDRWNKTLSSMVFDLHPSLSVSDLKIRATSSLLNDKERSEALTALAFINTRSSAQTMIDLTKSPFKDVAERATYWVSFRQSNDWFSLVDWKKTGIDTQHERQVAAMLVKKSRIDDEQLPFDEKKWSVQSMAKDPVGGQMLIGMVAENKLDKRFYPFVEELIFKNPDQSVRRQASNYFKASDSDRPYAIGTITSLKPNAIVGEALFAKNCISCHRVGKDGSDIGPELTEINKKFSREGLLDAIINPSAAIVFGYESWLITTKSGESVYGFLVSDGDEAIVVKDLVSKKHVIAVSDIISKKQQENSVMPRPSFLELSEQNLADLAEYLITLK
ncbi:MAG: HEAT repeat domain-containing protein [Bacteroidia bacterium]|nr:HEAT repeat domain-containing protein [Bacteroidia bacterium]